MTPGATSLTPILAEEKAEREGGAACKENAKLSCEESVAKEGVHGSKRGNTVSTREAVGGEADFSALNCEKCYDSSQIGDGSGILVDNLVIESRADVLASRVVKGLAAGLVIFTLSLFAGFG